MAASKNGIEQCVMKETPIAVVEMEVTGFNPGFDRVVEISVLRLEPGKEPTLALDTLIKPCCDLRGTEIHGLRHLDVAEAPYFRDIAGEVLRSIAGCVVGFYQADLDMRFLAFELAQIRWDVLPPHFDIANLRPMLWMGNRRTLEEMCELHDIPAPGQSAADEARATAAVLQWYLEEMDRRCIRTFADMAALKVKKLKYMESFVLPPIGLEETLKVPTSAPLKSRSGKPPTQSESNPLRAYWDAMANILTDLEVSDEEVKRVQDLRQRHGLTEETVRFLHAHVFASALSRFNGDCVMDNEEAATIASLHNCLRKLGWAPGE